jgi:hypothetical protein
VQEGAGGVQGELVALRATLTAKEDELQVTRAELEGLRAAQEKVVGMEKAVAAPQKCPWPGVGKVWISVNPLKILLLLGLPESCDQVLFSSPPCFRGGVKERESWMRFALHCGIA